VGEERATAGGGEVSAVRGEGAAVRGEGAAGRGEGAAGRGEGAAGRREGATGWRDGMRASVVWDALREVLTARAGATGRDRLDVIDAGGGTGGFAVPLAVLGHAVTVVDPSPDSLAAAQRRAAEIDVRIAAVQGDAAELDGVVGEDAADLVICHSVLEYVESPADALAAIARVLRPGGTVSVLAASFAAAILHRAMAGRLAEARVLLDRAGDPGSSPASGGPGHFTLPGLRALIEGAGLRPGPAHGVRIFADLVPSVFVDADPTAAAALRSLETAAATYPPLRDIATKLHMLGYR